LTTPVGDARALAAAARRLLQEPNLRSALSAGAVKRATEDFDHLVMAGRSHAIYAKVLESERVIRLPREQKAAARPWQYAAAPSLQPVSQDARPLLDAEDDEEAELAM
jgi:hypothetical protein